MSELITDAMVETGAKADYAHCLGDWDKAAEGARKEWRNGTRVVLEAVAPIIAAKALRDAADEVRNYAYRSDEVTHVGTSEQVPWLIGTSDAHRMVDRLLNERADRIEVKP